ncbi:hypothetical protein SUBVAR_06485 [Subdoligranulum variabile DSM 15176]|uniref:Uncharacterized protein n=1 Tax=Subdoligranulum variabile DSM 15176 TaxID=411471 RepID=D1PQ18_9FIRM|nr:hypothetical protein SUBVAR_06485 [Subdoligranulum variabile DSM 15176]
MRENELCSQNVCLTQNNRTDIIVRIRTVQKSVRNGKKFKRSATGVGKGGSSYERLRSH